MAKKLVKNYVFNPGKGVDDNILPNAYSLIHQNRTFIIKEIVGYINNQVDSGNPDYTGYTFSTVKCERDSGYIIDALLYDLRYGGNENTRHTASQYWIGGIAQVDGSRIPEYEAYQFAATLINTYILTNIEDTSPEQEIEQQVIDLSINAETGAAARVTSLLGTVVSVIQNGLSSLPEADIKLGRIEILGKVELEDLLLISNVTDNEVIYNFADPSRGGSVYFNEGNSDAYPNAESVNNGTTIIRFKLNTETMSSTDAIQIFLENTELRVRPYDFGTDAIERMRVAQPQAMLDADFEYGLQPTKWQAIGMQRGYPATYEVSATDVQVSSVVTDASTGTSGIGGSLITVTTISPHGFEVGDPITIKALAASITGFARAEGTFIIYSVPSTTTFTYYAKAKVGTSNGQVLATTTTQLRQADFYTGATVGVPSFSVLSNGSSGSFTTALQTESGQNTLTFIGAVPPVGAPLTGTGMPTGVQVTGSFGPANSDGIVDYRYVKTTVGSGSNSIELVDVTDLSANMALSSEDPTPVVREITSIAGNTLNLSGPIAVAHVGDETTYIGSAIGVAGTGTNCTVNVDVTSDVYSIASIANGGSGYAQGDTLKLSGTDLGGVSPDNDLYLNVDTVSGGAVTAVTKIQGLGTGTANFTSVTTLTVLPQGINAQFNIGRAGGVYTLAAVFGEAQALYYVGNRFRIPGTQFDGTSPTNDVIIQVTEVTVTNEIQAAILLSGTATRGDQIAVYATVTIGENTTTAVPAATTISYTAIATIEATFATNHGFVPGMGLNIAITSTGSNHELAGGPFFVENIHSPTTIRYIARSAGTINTVTTLEGRIYARPDSFFTHRPFDGGVQLGTGGPAHGGHAIRQSKKYIRYQSGKGAMYNTGALFAPSFDVISVTASGTAAGSLITIATDDVDHGVQAGSTIRLSGVLTTGYNGDYTVSEIVDERTFRVVAGTALGSSTGTIDSQCQIALVNWHGAVVRSGPFDDQNGIFFQYDGQNLAVGRRTSTFQIAGTIAIDRDKNLVTGTNTRFLDQLQEGDRIVIRGMTHVVSSIASNTSMTVTPDFRGVNAVSGVKVCKVQDLIIPQYEWNLDKCDGTGPSGYNIDVTKMQMIGIQFSWYGAGFIDWMLRGPSGEYIFVHRLKGNNLNTEAYMRTGNAPVRYEVLNEGARSRLNGSIDAAVTTIPLYDVSEFPSSGTVYIDNELISYTGKNSTTNSLTGCSRSASLSNFAAGAIRTYVAGSAASHNDRQGVVLVSCTTSPIISHWGSAYLIDGNFDEDRGYIFNYASTGISVTTTKQTAFLIRLAPSVSNAVTGDLGERELLNRAQLLLKAISITSDGDDGSGNQILGGIVVEGVLNPQNYPVNPSDVGWTGLTGQATGGQPSFAQIAPGGSVNWNGGASETTATATTTTTMTAALTIYFNITNASYMYVTKASWEASGAFNPGNFNSVKAGVIINDTEFTAGTRITSVQGPYSNAYYYITTDRRGTTSTSSTVTLNLGGNSSSSTNLLYFTSARWVASGAKANTEVSEPTKFPAGTKVSSVTGPTTFGATTYYAVSFTQSSIASVSAGGTITFKFGQPPYALPGEQVFSFITQPGSSDTLDLSELKELGTTSIGGRGAFPNGPDVLAINVYKASGDATNTNIILRWGEAQA